MKEKTIVSTVTLLTSLLAYWYSKEAEKDSVPYVMMGGFLGSILGETIVERVHKSNKIQ
ncbi:hypothetical protein [Flaviaesturariibacter aridisoli]|uniref:hypothetical protein n=1 Tax=Flaviaesturariibacter aridisoli TaxID=2545761 RepID=UPI0014050E08|nr:hypothetical protein [Flaviaesturariibacter aridisoli]